LYEHTCKKRQKKKKITKIIEKTGKILSVLLGRFPVLLAKMQFSETSDERSTFKCVEWVLQECCQKHGKDVNAKFLTVLAKLQINTLSMHYIDAKQNHLHQ